RRMAKDHELVDGRHEPPGFAAGTRSVLPAATGRRAEKQSWRRLTVAMSHDLPVPSEATCSFLLFVMCGNDQTGNRIGSPKVAPTVEHHLRSERRLTVYELSGDAPGRSVSRVKTSSWSQSQGRWCDLTRGSSAAARG